jgi:hypothetical protein
MLRHLATFEEMVVVAQYIRALRQILEETAGI